MNKKKICIGIIVVLVVFNLICFSIFLIKKKQIQVSEKTEEFIYEEDLSDEELQDNIYNEVETEEISTETTDEKSEIEESSMENKIETSTDTTAKENPKTNETNTTKTQSNSSTKTETIGANIKVTNQNTKEENRSITQQETIQSNNSEIKTEETKKIDLSKYDYYETGLNGTYKGFIKDTQEIENLKSLINTCINENGYKNVKVESIPDSSLARSGLRYFTANKTNVNNAINDCDGFTISYYAVKEYNITANGTETFFQTRSYIKVK